MMCHGESKCRNDDNSILQKFNKITVEVCYDVPNNNHQSPSNISHALEREMKLALSSH